MAYDHENKVVTDVDDIGDVPNVKVFSWLMLVVWSLSMINIGLDWAIFERLKVTGVLAVVYFIWIVVMIYNYEKAKFGRYK